MKIIKCGNVDNLRATKHFVCKHCGCEFTADKGEYEIGTQYNELYYYAKCPTCHKTIYTLDED